MADQASHPESESRKPLTADRLREVLTYNPDIGEFQWKPDRWRVRRAGAAFRGTPDGTGYLMIRVDYIIYKAHRLAWLYMTGEWPENILDHVNGDRADNRWVNLRSANHVLNAGNSRRRAAPVKKYRGVRHNPHCPNHPYSVTIGFNNMRIYLGSFETAELAYAAYCGEAQRLRGEFARLD